MVRISLATIIAAAISSLLLLAALPRTARAVELKVLSGSGVQPAMIEIIPGFEQSSGHKVTFDYGTVGGMADRVQKGEAADVIIASGPQIEVLEKQGKVVGGSRADLAKTGVGIFVRKGAPRPDISSVDALKRTLVEAKSIAYSSSISGVYLSTELFQRLGVADQVLPKSRRIDGERVGAVVARGEAEIGFQQVSELVPIAGIDTWKSESTSSRNASNSSSARSTSSISSTDRSPDRTASSSGRSSKNLGPNSLSTASSPSA